MKKAILFLTLFSVNCFAAIQVKKEKHILFIGNSLTSYNSMPGMVQKMIDERKLNIKIEQLTISGMGLGVFATHAQHEDGALYRCENNEIPIGVRAILSKKWDLVILQERGGEELIPCHRIYTFEPALIFLDSVIRSIKARTVVYQDYAGNSFPYHICDYNSFEENEVSTKVSAPNLLISRCSINFDNSEQEFKEIEQAYYSITKKLNAKMVKIGYAFELFKKTNKSINLYDKDNTHPSPQGSYLIACLFYKNITGETLSKVKYSAGLDINQAAVIREFANAIK